MTCSDQALDELQGLAACSLLSRFDWVLPITCLTPPQNNPRRPLVTPVRPPPVEQHDQAVAEADQEEHVHDQPEPPGQQAGEAQRAEIDHRRHAADGGQVAVVLVGERRRRHAAGLALFAVRLFRTWSFRIAPYSFRRDRA